MASPSTRNIDVVEFLHRHHQRPLEGRRGGLGLERPCHDIDIVLFEQCLEPGEFLLAPAVVIAIEEAADHVIGFARAAMPGTKLGALLAAFKCQGLDHGGSTSAKLSPRHPCVGRDPANISPERYRQLIGGPAHTGVTGRFALG